MKNFTGKLAVFILSLFLIVYSFYQVSQFIKEPYTTEIAYEYTIADSYTGKGFFIREEVDFPIENDGLINFNYPNGTKVNEDEKLAECFDDEKSAETVFKIHNLERQIENLQNISANFSANYGASDNISRQIASEISFINSDVFKGNLIDLSAKRQNVLNGLNKKLINSGKTNNFNDKIAELERELTYLKSTLRSEPLEIISPLNGYFSSVSDCLGDRLTADVLDKITVADCTQIVNNPPKPNENYSKIITSCNWYFALSIPKEKIMPFQIGREVRVSFPLLDLDDIKARIARINISEDETEESVVVIFKCNYVLDKLTTERVTEINIKFKSYNGFKIDADAIRFQNNVKGVYVIDDQQVKFRPINIIYEDNGYVVASTYMENCTTVQSFDKIIVEGVDLYDGKPI